ncbi:MAG: ATP synthase F0 subunit B [Sedimentisphaerales bacterium]
MRSRISMAVLIMFFACGVVAASEGGPAATEPSIFSGTFADALWTVAAFVLLVAVLGKLAWKPILSRLDAREKYIKEQIETAENARKKAEKLLEENKHQALQIVTDAAKQAQKETQELTEKTRQDVLEIRRRAHEDIRHARTAASEQLWKETGDIIQALGSEVLKRTITQEDNQRFIDEAVLRLRQKKDK